MSSIPPPPPGMGSSSGTPKHPDHSSLKPETRADAPSPYTTGSTAADTKPVVSETVPTFGHLDPVPVPAADESPIDVDPDADDEDIRLIRDAFTIPRSDILKKLVREPSDAFPYSEELGGTFSLAEAQKTYERRSAETVVRQAMEQRDAQGLTEALDLEIARNYYDDLVAVTSEDYDEYAEDIVIGNRDHNIRLVGDRHMVRVLATKKAGKTTFVLELIRCSITGERPFEAFDMLPLAPDEKVLFLDPELQESSFRRYIKSAFAGMTEHQVNEQFIRVSTRNHVNQFDLMSERTRDELVRVINKFNIKRVVFDSYVKLMPNGSVSKEDDVKRMLANWDYVQTNTDVRESFWVGHVNNGGEIRSSGSILLDGTFESLLALVKDPEGRRFFQAEEGRMTDAVSPKPYTLDPATGRPLILLDSTVTPVTATGTGSGSKKAEMSETKKVMDEAVDNNIRTTIVWRLYRSDETPTATGELMRGGFEQNELVDIVQEYWKDSAFGAPGVPGDNKIRTAIKAMVDVHGQLFLDYSPGGGKKKYFLTQTAIDEIDAAAED